MKKLALTIATILPFLANAEIMFECTPKELIVEPVNSKPGYFPPPKPFTVTYSPDSKEVSTSGVIPISSYYENCRKTKQALTCSNQGDNYSDRLTINRSSLDFSVFTESKKGKFSVQGNCKKTENQF